MEIQTSPNAPISPTYIVQTSDTILQNEQVLASLSTGIMKVTTGTGIISVAVAGDFPTLNQNTTGTAANLSGTPALPDGTTAVTQAGSDNSTKLATTAYVDAGGGGGASQLSDLSDVNTSTPTDKNVLVADGIDWESRALVEADISNLGSYQTADAALTSISGLAYVSASFIKLTGNDTYAVRTLAQTLSDIGAEPVKGADDNYVTDAEKTVIGNTSGVNTGNQTTITGNAGSATVLQNARTINGVSFNGSANIVVAAAAGTLTGNTIKSTVLYSSLRSLGTIATGVWHGTDVGVAYGGTGRSSHTAYAVIVGGTSTTAAQQSIASVGTSGQVLTSNGASAKPTFQTVAGGASYEELWSSETNVTNRFVWEDWDISALVQAGAKWVDVLIKFGVVNDTKEAGVRKNGSALDRKIYPNTKYVIMRCECDASGIIERFSRGASAAEIKYRIIGSGK